MQRSRPASVRGARRASVSSSSVIERLENRQLMSVTAPAGYVAVQSLTLDAVTLAAQSIPVTADRDYYFKASGAHVMSSNPTLHADAASFEPYVDLWADDTRLHIAAEGVDLVNWGHHVIDNEYGASYHSDSNATLTAYISDSFAADNAGSLSLVVYRKVIVGTVTAVESGGVGAGVTASGTNDGIATLSVTPNASSQSTVNLSAVISPNTTEARDKAVWAAYDASNNVIGGDSFDSGGDSITLTFSSPATVFTIRSGTDTNGNGAFDYGLETANRTITVQRVVPGLAVTSTSAAGASSGNRLSISAGSSAAFDSVMRSVNGSATSATFSFVAASGVSVTASAKLDGSYRMTVAVASGVAPGNYTIAITDATDSRVAPIYLYITV